MTRTAWAIWITLVGVLSASMAFAQPADPRRDQVVAATARAVDRLKAQIAQEPVGRNTTVGDVLDATSGSDTFIKTLQRAQMIGGPRWLDDQTCQVRLEISGPRAAAALVSIVAANPKKSPIAPELLAGRLKQWENRTFCATSTSTGSTVVEQVRPVEEGAAWAQISDGARQQAIAAAKRNACGQVIRAIGSIPLVVEKTVADALADAKVKAAVDQWLASRPVTQIEFRDDLQVGVTLATPASELADAFRAAVEKSPAAGHPSEAEWSRIRGAIEDRVPDASHGTARAGLLSVTRSAFALPTAAPSWVNDQIDADGSSRAASRLQSARAAETDAQNKLRAKIDALPLSPGLSVGDAARQDPRIADAVARTIGQARASKVDYQADGGAKVRVGLELHDLWDAIVSAR